MFNAIGQALEHISVPSNQDRSGIWAIAGFLYQIVGMLSLTVDIAETSSWDDSSESNDALFEVPNAGSFIEAIHENLGQDASYISPNNDTVLVQFKYSANSYQIQKRDIEEIVKKLIDSAESAKDRGLNVSACVLATNREFVSTAARYWEEVCAVEREFELLCLHDSMKDWGFNLEVFGKRHGASADEISNGINSLIGRIVRETGSQYPRVSITIQDLKEAIIGYGAAQSITEDSVVRYTSEKIGSYKEFDPGIREPLIRREILDEISEQCVQHALIVLHGKGGCGKTTSMWQWINDRVFVALASTEDVTENWPANEMCNWADLPPDHRWRQSLSLNQVVSRIRVANPEHSIPLLHLAVDGLDEDHPQIDLKAVRALIRHFWDMDRTAMSTGQPPEAILILTCRDIRDIEEKWLSVSLSGFGTEHKISAIPVGGFSNDELAEAMIGIPTADISEEVRNRILQSIEAQSDTLQATAFMSPSYRSFAAQIRTIDRKVLEAVRHPAMFRAFLLIDDEHQVGVLDSESSSLFELASRFVDRFCRKILRRGKLQGIRSDVLDLVLRNIAAAHSCNTADAPWHKYLDWIQASMEDGYLNSNEAKRLYNEALSGGLIFEGSPNQWQWTYCWVRDYLSLDVQ